MSDDPENRVPSASETDSEWRILAFNQAERIEFKGHGVLDEVVIGSWLHLEQMNDQEWWMQLGDAWIWIRVGPDATVTVDVERGCYGEVNGQTIGVSASEDATE